MVQALRGERVGERLHHMVLPHHFGEVAGAVFAGEHEIGHGVDSKVPIDETCRITPGCQGESLRSSSQRPRPYGGCPQKQGFSRS